MLVTSPCRNFEHRLVLPASPRLAFRRLRWKGASRRDCALFALVWGRQAPLGPATDSFAAELLRSIAMGDADVLAALASAPVLLEATLRLAARSREVATTRFILTAVPLPRTSAYSSHSSEEYALLKSLAAAVAVIEPQADGARAFLREHAQRKKLEEEAAPLSPLRSRPEPRVARVALASVLVIERLALGALGQHVDEAWERASATAMIGNLLPEPLERALTQ
jgi:hypothetical protein